ncbi:helix-turn-helix domain-containing protein [Streptacidiphilus sp. P02-A3a]|uniref:PucR family transcriptional regulator n=1 Tax=Streptacidiphilus sp. P02-A3a TaxID=2704468 RepID=UPI001CDBD4ED|nr:helix-turn-helix domain-containing protein [Streptacidiphilus sp. P02-A3a]
MPRCFAAEIRKERETLAAEIIREIRQQVPEFSRPLAGHFGAGIQYGVETALADFADLVEGAGPRARRPDTAAEQPTARRPNGHGRERSLSEERVRVYRALGRGELAEGRTLDALQAAYRLGARVAWRRYARVARRVGLGPDLVVTLAEAIFAHIDEIASASVEGYAEARADHAGTQGRLRHQLLELLVTGAQRAELERAALAADWPVPDRLACVALGPPAGVGPEAARRRRLPDPVLADLDCAQPYLLLPDPAVLLAGDQIRWVLRGRGAVVGPVVPPELAADSLRWARTIRATTGDPPADGLAPSPAEFRRERRDEPLSCDDRLPELLLRSDAPLVRLMAARRLAPLEALTAKQSDRLAATLLAWLQTNSGSAPEVAARLGIHPQTARQRLHRVQELFGAALRDPDSRFELEVALRGRQLYLGSRRDN